MQAGWRMLYGYVTKATAMVFHNMQIGGSEEAVVRLVEG